MDKSTEIYLGIVADSQFFRSMALLARLFAKLHFPVDYSSRIGKRIERKRKEFPNFIHSLTLRTRNSITSPSGFLLLLNHLQNTDIRLRVRKSGESEVVNFTALQNFNRRAIELCVSDVFTRNSQPILLAEQSRQLVCGLHRESSRKCNCLTSSFSTRFS